LIDVERTDFVSVPVRDMARAKQFYSEALGLPSPNLIDPDVNALMLHRRYAPAEEKSA
jgi:catechol 2,3-dioxygenase-like lactoylglutathione lyase family enzyme